MSQLQLTIPITFEPTALLSIKEDSITREVIDVNGNSSEMQNTANSMSMYVNQSGLQLEEDKIILNSNKVYIKAKNGTSTEFFENINGKPVIKTGFINANIVTANTLSTNGTCNIIIENGKIIARSTENNSYIQLGIDNNGYASLKYYIGNTLQYELTTESVSSWVIPK